MNEMVADKRPNNMFATLLLRAMFTGLVLLASSAVSAEGSFLLNPNLKDLKEGYIMLAPIGRGGAGVRMSMDAPGQDNPDAFRMSNNGMWQINDGASEVYMSLVIPW